MLSGGCRQKQNRGFFVDLDVHGAQPEHDLIEVEAEGYEIIRRVFFGQPVNICREARRIDSVDDRAATMRDVLLKDDHANIVSEMKKLSEQQVQDLEAYLLSL